MLVPERAGRGLGGRWRAVNPWGLDATGLLVWGVVAHLVADWPLQNEAIATRKSNLRDWPGWLHAAIHTVAAAVVFGWPAVGLGLAHLLVDTRHPVDWVSRRIDQVQPAADGRLDLGVVIRIVVDQVWHVACIAVAALLVAG